MDLNVNVFTLFGYSMSLLELLGTFTNAYSVWLMARLRIATWPVGIVGSILFAVLFYQIRLYGDFIEQIYYIGVNIYGWITWKKRGSEPHTPVAAFSQSIVIGGTFAGTIIASLIFGALLTQVHLWAPAFFVEKADYPYIDALTTMGSFVAMILMAKGRIESWIYWIVINIVSIVLYAYKGVYFVSGLYGVYLVLAFLGYQTWVSQLKKQP